VAANDLRIAWLLTAEAFERGGAANEACLSVAADAGFRVVAMNYSTPTGGIEPKIEAEARRHGLQCILVNDAAHCRLSANQPDVERWSLAQALSREGFDGFILCEACNSRTRAESLLATARVLLRYLDQLDWESYH
jgi:hypothetical protein